VGSLPTGEGLSAFPWRTRKGRKYGGGQGKKKSGVPYKTEEGSRNKKKRYDAGNRRKRKASLRSEIVEGIGIRGA